MLMISFNRPMAMVRATRSARLGQGQWAWSFLVGNDQSQGQGLNHSPSLVLALIPRSHSTILLGLLRPKLSYATFRASGRGQFRGLPLGQDYVRARASSSSSSSTSSKARARLGLKLVLLAYQARTKCILITIHSSDDALNSVYTVYNETYIRMLESFASPPLLLAYQNYLNASNSL